MTESNDIIRKKISVRTGRRLQKKNVKNDYDVIVVGSGIGGLINASLLALLGKKVCVLEQHYTAGGFTHAYQRKGYEWDVGVHYIGEVHRPNSSLRRLFDVVSEKRLQWQEMDPIYDRIFIGDESFNLVAGTDNFIASLTKQFPQEQHSIEEYVKLVRHISYHSPKFFAGQAMPKWMATAYHWLRPKLIKPEFFQTTREVLEKITNNQKLISVLTGQWGDYGLPPSESSFVIHALLVKHYLAGGAYPVGGASSIAREIIPTILKAGGDVFTDAKVEHVIVKNGQASGVKLTNGLEIQAEKIVSNIGYINTVKKLIPIEYRQKFKLLTQTKKIKPSGASLCLYCGFKGTSEELGLDTTNLWIYSSENHELSVKNYEQSNAEDGEFPVVYISFPSTKDPLWNERFPNKSTVEIVTLSKMKWFEKWLGSEWSNRGEDYKALKEKLSQKLLAILFKHRPQLKNQLDYYELSTPLSTEYYQLNVQGEIYGLEHSVDRFNQLHLHPETPIKNLFLTGADTMTAGVGGAAMSGFITTMRMQGTLGANRVKNLLVDG